MVYNSWLLTSRSHKIYTPVISKSSQNPTPYWELGAEWNLSRPLGSNIAVLSATVNQHSAAFQFRGSSNHGQGEKGLLQSGPKDQRPENLEEPRPSNHPSLESHSPSLVVLAI